MANLGLKERRQMAERSPSVLRAQLNDAQRQTLGELERFGWQIQFVRRPLFQDPVPVVVDGDRKQYAVLTPEGDLDEAQALHYRQR